MKSAKNWKDYSVIATGDGYKLEKWGNVVLLRPDPQVIWKSQSDMQSHPELCAKYLRSSTGGGGWEYYWCGTQYPDLDTLYEALSKQKRFMELTITVNDEDYQ